MQFYQPEYLRYMVFLLAVPVLAWISGRIWRARVRRMGQESLIRQKLMPSYRRGEAGTRVFLIFMALFFMLFALARPQWGESEKLVNRKGVDVLFLLDTSLSMLAEDIKPNRFEKAKHEIKSIVRKLKGDRVGLVVFSGSAYLQTPFTLDSSAFMLFLDAVKVGHVPDPGSSLDAALGFILRVFPKEDLKYKVLILITEGEDTLSNPEETLKELRNAGIRVYTLGVGTPDGGPIPLKDASGRQVGFKKDREGQLVVTRLNEEALKTISTETGGLYLRATPAEREVDLLLKHIGSLGQKNINEKMITEKEDHYGLFLIFAFVCLILEMLTKRTRRLRRTEQTALVLLAFVFFTGFIETPRSLNNQANKDYTEKKYQSAIEDYQKAKIKTPDDAAIRYNLGSALYQTDQFQDARREFQKAVELSKEPSLQAKGYYNLGNAEYRLGNFDGAIAAYKEALKRDPSDQDAKHNLEFVQNQKSLFDKKNEDRKKDQQQDQNQDQQQDQQNQQNQNQDQQQNQQNQNQQNQDQQNSQDQQGQGQNQQNSQGGQGGSSGQSDSNSQNSPQNQQQNQDQQQDQQNQNQDQQQNQQNQNQQNQDQQNSQGQQGQGQDQQSQGGTSTSDSQQQQQQESERQKPGEEPQSGQQEQQQQDQQPAEEKQQGGQKPQSGDSSGGQEQSAPQPKPAQAGQTDEADSGQGEEESQPAPQPDPETKGDAEAPQPEAGEGTEEFEQEQPDFGMDESPGQEFEPQPGDQQQEDGADGESGEEGGQGPVPANAAAGGGGGGTQYQGQMSSENALKILDALHDSEKEFSDLRRPASKRRASAVLKDW